jgi:drug/metabolite transporter (DMT)-like permease
MAWGFAFLLIAIGLKSFPPLTLVTLRLIVGALVLYLIMRWQGLKLPTDSHWWLRFVVLSVLGNLVPFTLISWGQLRIASSQAGLLMALVPISTMVLAHFFVAYERLTPQRILGVLAGFAGVTALVGGEALRGLGGASLAAQLAIITATFAYAVNNIYTKRLPSHNGLVTATGSLIAGALVILPFCLLIERPWELQINTAPLLATVALGVFSTGLATWVYFVVVSNCGPNFLSLINYIIPALSFAAGALLLGEAVNSWQFVGLAAICSGIAISQYRRRPGE